MIRFCVNRLGGQPLEIQLTEEEANQLQKTKDLKKILATADKCAPAVCVVRLLHDVEVQDNEPIKWDLLEQGAFQYVVQQAESDFPESIVFRKDPKVFDRQIVISLAHKIWVDAGGDQDEGHTIAFEVCSQFFDAWKAAVEGIPPEKANYVDSDGRTSLDRLVALLAEVSRVQEEIPQTWSHLEEFILEMQKSVGEMAIEFVKEKLSDETVIQTFQTPSDEMRETLRMLIYVDNPLGIEAHGKSWFGSEFILALMAKGLPRWCWGGHATSPGDNLLQYMLGVRGHPTQFFAYLEKTEFERKLCIQVAKSLSLEELCERYQGQNVLHRANCAVASSRGPHEYTHLWMKVRATIWEQMEERVREFEGHLMDLVALTASVLDALEGDCLPAFNDQLRQRAEMGWRFASATFEDQIWEVVNWHFRFTP